MTKLNRKLLNIVLAGLAATICLSVSGKNSFTSRDGFMSSAYAIIGRPLTPLSYAGVARRTTRRAVVAGAAVGTAAAVAPRCVQTVDAYGRIYTRCY